MSDWLDAIPNLGVQGVRGVAPQQSAICEQVFGVRLGVHGVARHLDATPETPAATPSATPENAEKPQKSQGGHPRHLGHPKNKDSETICREWRAGLSTLACSKPPAGMSTMRWGQLLDDAEFIFNGFANQLAREGWSTLDVFGVLPWREGGGVLLDRLQGARNLKLDGEGRAFWSHDGVTFQTSRDVGEHLVSSGLLLIWDTRMLSSGANP